ncbi:uncharacterized protein BHQ10_003029 [Talaromyces amestolkiae]|uniref:Uncharacterized protein n=1 Tax=Talaromyces amestolkiae TaxID=1196081 RepID=A0A364KTY4_TALAM|nr:uncharacterized protein BHQ10_003029 [Talaromyces amestolkiae]RAO67017.1 hypothetical protein BHQ10_003029 [Talaromyces amestolkiae]
MNRNPSIDAVLYANQHNLSSDSFRQLSEVPQERAQGTVHLKYYRDVRTIKHEHLAIEEGSLVMSIAPYFTNLSQQLTRSDEFELRIGEVYVVSHMYADMWALCVRLRNSEGVADVKIDDLKDSPNIKFIPLCAVTLASNFSAFYRRCASYRDNPPYTRFFPAGGSLITPPRRKESLLVSRKYFTECTHQISFSLPPIVYTLCHAPRKMQAGLAYEPLDYGTESQKEETAAEAAVDDHKQQHGTLRQRFWAMFAERESKSSDKGKQPEVSPSNDGLGSGGKTIHTKSTESPPDHDHDMDAAVVKAKRPEVSQKNAGPESGGKMSHPKSTEVSKDHDQDAARDDSEDRAGNATGNGNNVSKRKSVRNFFSRSMRIKNGDTGVEV